MALGGTPTPTTCNQPPNAPAPPNPQAFETGQIGPRRLARMLGESAPRNATIHEYLDWTCTAVEAKDETEYVRV